MFVTTLFVQALLAASALALPSSKARFAERTARRSLSRQAAANASHVEYSSNWAGAVLSKTTVSGIL